MLLAKEVKFVYHLSNSEAVQIILHNVKKCIWGEMHAFKHK